jgi:hypothetical protein
MDWIKFGYAALIVGMMFWIYPTAKHWIKNGPKAEKGDWQAFLLPIALIILFVGGLMWAVSR